MSRSRPAINFSFPRGDFSQTMRDIAKIFFGALFATGVGLGFAFFVLFSVRVG